jgi:hypothetical protein
LPPDEWKPLVRWAGRLRAMFERRIEAESPEAKRSM